MTVHTVGHYLLELALLVAYPQDHNFSVHIFLAVLFPVQTFRHQFMLEQTLLAFIFTVLISVTQISPVLISVDA